MPGVGGMQMKLNEFYSKYANTPIEQRLVSLNIIQHGYGFSLANIYAQLNDLNTTIQELQIEQANLLELAEEGYKNLEKTYKTP